ncbi:hypothetical protein R1sor_026289 [Riccia sorocarpa]|uniref:WAT1-related protein n=1 Tax=Riccia sorocarpa TaxID=122646 RepID=A0ABD3GCE8_9MARC
MSIYKGPAVYHGWVKEPSNDLHTVFGPYLGGHLERLGITQWQLGGILLLINCVSWAAYLIMQAPILRICPSPLTITAFTYFFGSAQSWTIIVVILSMLVLDDSLYLGSVVGGIGAVSGLYLVTWGQVEHRRRDVELTVEGKTNDLEATPHTPTPVSSLTQPLLEEDDEIFNVIPSKTSTCPPDYPDITRFVHI